jgi:hypothetical protein
MGPVGFEPTCLAAADFKSAASAYFATGPYAASRVRLLKMTAECKSLGAHHFVREIGIATR